MRNIFAFSSPGGPDNALSSHSVIAFTGTSLLEEPNVDRTAMAVAIGQQRLCWQQGDPYISSRWRTPNPLQV